MPSSKNPPVSVCRQAEPLRQKLSRTMLRTVGDYGLIEDGDRIMVAISGGKDSYTLLDLLVQAQKKAPIRFELIAFHLNQKQPGYDNRAMREWLARFGAPFEIHEEDTYSLVLEQTAGTQKAFCGPCSRLRRGILYTHAERLGCHKVALGHHRDDTLQTLLMNLFYSGKLQAMPARFRTQDDRFDVIRPLIECDEKSIAEYARLREFPIMPCNLCGSQEGLKRVQIESLIQELETQNPQIRQVMLNALKNVRPSHLLDREVTQAWEQASSQFSPRQ